MDWMSAGQQWLIKAAHEEWKAQGCPIPRGRRGRQYVPPQWQIDAMVALGRRDEETFKAIKLFRLGVR